MGTKWDRRLDELQRFISTHGRWPAYEAEDPYEWSLNKWCSNQRFLNAKGKLSLERVERLEGISFFDVFSRHEDRWIKIFKRLKRHYEARGSLPRSSEASGLAVWMYLQENGYDQLAGWKKELLSSIRFLEGMQARREQWGVNRRKDLLPVWKEKLAEVAAFYHLNGRFPCRRDDRLLFGWLNNQRQLIKANEMDPVRVRLLEESDLDIMEGTRSFKKKDASGAAASTG